MLLLLKSTSIKYLGKSWDFFIKQTQNYTDSNTTSSSHYFNHLNRFIPQFSHKVYLNQLLFKPTFKRHFISPTTTIQLPPYWVKLIKGNKWFRTKFNPLYKIQFTTTNYVIRAIWANSRRFPVCSRGTRDTDWAMGDSRGDVPRRDRRAFPCSGDQIMWRWHPLSRRPGHSDHRRQSGITGENVVWKENPAVPYPIPTLACAFKNAPIQYDLNFYHCTQRYKFVLPITFYNKFKRFNPGIEILR